MVTFNVSMDLNVANGARGHIVDIVLDGHEEINSNSSQMINLQHPPIYILVWMICMKVHTLEDLENGVLPIMPLTKMFSVITASGNKITITRLQLPVTLAYAFTNYRSQAQTINHCIVDLATPPTGKLTPFNAYVDLSRSHSRHSIRLLRDFDERLFTHHPSEHLRMEDEQINKLDHRMKKKWEEHATGHV